MKPKFFYLRTVPLIWFAFSLTLYFNPGDEYGAFAIGSILGTWPLFLIKNLTFNAGSAIAIATGVLCCIGLGYVMDRLKIKPKCFFVTFVILSLIFFTWLFFDTYGSLEWVRAKHGTLTCLVAFCLNIGLTISLLGTIVVSNIKRFALRFF